MPFTIPDVSWKRAASIYPAELLLGYTISWLVGQETLEVQRRNHYLLGSRNVINAIFAYKGNLVWTVDFLCLASVLIYVKCQNHALLPTSYTRETGKASYGPLKGLLKQYFSKIVLKNALLVLIFLFIDNVFIMTGGSCVDGESTRSAERCRVSGGQWAGGFDISGHFCFLVNISMILWLEISQFRCYMGRESVVFPARKIVNSVLLLTFGVLGVWISMLLVTAIYYHTLLEKILGCALGYVCVVVMYGIVPRSRSLNSVLYD